MLPFHLRVYLDASGNADGELYWDDGVSLDAYDKGAYDHINFACSDKTLISRVDVAGYKKEITLGWIGIFGLKDNVKSVKFNGKAVKFQYDAKLQVRNFFSAVFSSLNNQRVFFRC